MLYDTYTFSNNTGIHRIAQSEYKQLSNLKEDDTLPDYLNDLIADALELIYYDSPFKQLSIRFKTFTPNTLSIKVYLS